jgi:hypothetical protein
MPTDPVPETTPPTTAVAHLLDLLDDVPNFLFGEDVAAACAMLERSPLVSEAVAARHLRTLVDGCRDTPGFPFGDDLDAAERALTRWEACNG